MMEQTKTARRRVANFSPDEKALLVQLIKKTPIIESKLTDGKSVAKKKAAWEAITEEFNSHAYVLKRDTISLKRAWDNMKALTRKTQATECGNLIRTGGGPSASPQLAHQDTIVSMVAEADPVIITEIKNTCDSDDNQDEVESNDNNIQYSIHLQDKKDYERRDKRRRKPADYIRREALCRIKHLEAKNKIEMNILKTQLETENIKKRAAELQLQLLEKKVQLELM